MRTLAEISRLFLMRMKAQGVRQADLSVQAGIARRTLTAVLSGDADYKVTTLMAVADRLGYELALVPKDAMSGLGDGGAFLVKEPEVKTRIQQALARNHKKVEDA
jgi:transcriptional regulator with XRE-family HTH domain